MSNIAHKLPLTQTLNIFAKQKAADQIEVSGLSLPGHVDSVDGAIVSVVFDVKDVNLEPVQMPLFGPEYIRYPIKQGDKGVAVAMSAYLGATSGLGPSNSIADLVYIRGNLANLVWLPIGNADWSDVDDTAVTIYAPNGVVLRDSDSNTVETLTPDGIDIDAKDTYEITAGTSITFTVGSHSIVLDSSGVTIDGKLFLTHFHTEVVTGSDPSGPVG